MSIERGSAEGKNLVKDEGKVREPTAEPPQLKSALSKLTSESEPKVLREMMAFMSGPVGNPLHQKMDSEHITQVLDLAVKHDEREYDLAKSASASESAHRKLTTILSFLAFLVVAVVVILSLYLFQSKPDVLIPVLTGIGGFLSGSAAGFGLGRSKKE
jgi:hypothetical protein